MPVGGKISSDGHTRGIFFYDNYITSSTMITATSLKPGIVTAPYKEGAGSGSLKVFGDYTGAEDLEYVVEIDSTVGGNDVGQAEYRWRDGTAWDASTILTMGSTTYATVTNGVKFYFTTGVGNDFELGDIWYFKGLNLFNPGKAIDWNRDTKYKPSTIGESYIKFDLATARVCQALIIYDHNLKSTAAITINGGTAATSLTVNDIVTWKENKIIHLLSTDWTYRYWELQILDTTNTAIEIGEIYLGSYWIPGDNYQYEPNESINVVSDKKYTQSGVRKEIYYNKRDILNLTYPYMKSTDDTSFETMITSICDSTIKQYQPVYFAKAASASSEAKMYYVNDIRKVFHKHRKSWSFELEETIKSV